MKPPLINGFLASLKKLLLNLLRLTVEKEFSNWKAISNQHDIDIYFADPGTPSQRPLNENSNGILRRNGLPKSMDFREVNQTFISSVSNQRNHIPRKIIELQNTN